MKYFGNEIRVLNTGSFTNKRYVMYGIRSKFVCLAKSVILSDIALHRCMSHKGSIVSIGNSNELDAFIDNLLNNKKIKWKIKNKNTNNVKVNNEEGDTAKSLVKFPCKLSKESVDEYILKNCNSMNIQSVLDICLKKEICPSQEVMIKLGHLFAQNGNKDCIGILLSLSEIDSKTDSKVREEYRILQAEANWRSGGSVEMSLQVFFEVYKGQPALRRHVRSSLKSLFAEIIQNRGEASLIQAKKLVIQISSFPYDDYIPLSFLWSRCILSECFADQKMAIEMVEDGKSNPLLKKALGNRVDAVLGEALITHQIDAVYRLLEALLKLSLPRHSEVVLGKLFDYKFFRGDIDGCESVIKACDDLNLDVGFTRRNQLEKLRSKMKNKIDDSSGSKSETKMRTDFSPKSVPKFKFKI